MKKPGTGHAGSNPAYFANALNTHNMRSPFYEAEMRRLHPHRSMADTVDHVAIGLQRLIDDGVDTEENMRNTIIRDLQNKYFPRADSFCICEAFEILRIK